jgi:hypothetical protein
MALIKLRKANESGDEVGVLFVNTDQIWRSVQALAQQKFK